MMKKVGIVEGREAYLEKDLVRQHDEELEFGGKCEVGIAMYLVQELVLQHYQIEFELEGNGNCISWRTSGGG
jgi:hypothetical protein